MRKYQCTICRDLHGDIVSNTTYPIQKICDKCANPEGNKYELQRVNEILYRKPWRKRTEEEEQIIHRHWKYCPDGTYHKYEVKADESYMCDTLYVCSQCGQRRRVDSSD
jgi:hypothetical protein